MGGPQVFLPACSAFSRGHMPLQPSSHPSLPHWIVPPLSFPPACRHRLLIFRDQGIVSGPRQAEIGRWFGDLESTFRKHPRSPHPDVFRVSNDPAEGCIGEAWLSGCGAVKWSDCARSAARGTQSTSRPRRRLGMSPIATESFVKRATVRSRPPCVQGSGVRGGISTAPSNPCPSPTACTTSSTCRLG